MNVRLKFNSGKLLIKYFLIISSLAVVLGLILISTALIICDDDDYRKLAVWVVKRVAGYRMIVDGPFTVGISTQLSLTVEGIRFEPLEGGSCCCRCRKKSLAYVDELGAR